MTAEDFKTKMKSILEQSIGDKNKEIHRLGTLVKDLKIQQEKDREEIQALKNEIVRQKRFIRAHVISDKGGKVFPF